MAMRFHHPVERRVTLPLTADDVDHLESLKQNAELRGALRALTDAPVDGVQSPTEAALLHALLSAGWRSLHGEAEADGYHAMAAERQASTTERRAQARRRPAAWADEA